MSCAIQVRAVMTASRAGWGRILPARTLGSHSNLSSLSPGVNGQAPRASCDALSSSWLARTMRLMAATS
eukprot:14297177-Alexandrium_andersonii.AAC.1